VSRAQRLLLGGFIAALIGAACHNPVTSNSQTSILTAAAAAFDSAPAGYSNLTSSFGATSNAPFQPPFGPQGMGGGPPPLAGPGPMGGGHGLMCGGLGGPFLGDGLAVGFGPGPFGRGGPPQAFGACTFSSTTGVVTCPPISIGGLTITRTAIYVDTAGNHQAAPDSITASITTNVNVSGTITRRDSSTSTVTEASTQRVTGLGPGSTARTINGTSSGTESTSGTSSQGSFTSDRAVGDTTNGLVIPTPVPGTPDYPTAGTTIRAATVTLTLAGGTPTTSSRREVVTYTGSNTATVVITQDGATKTCTLPLPHGQLSCQ